MMSIGSIGKGEYNSVKDNRTYMMWNYEALINYKVEITD